MKKKLFIVLAVIMALSLALAACGGGTEPAPAEPADPAPAPAEPAPAPEPTAPAEPVETVTLTLMNHETPLSTTALMLDRWIAAVEEASGGTIKIEAHHGDMGGPRDTYNFVVDGAADIGFGLPSFYPGQFPATDVIALPFLGAKNSMQAGHTNVEMYETTPELQAEWTDVKMICMYTNTVAPLITKDKKIEKLEDLKGYNIRTIGGPVTEFMKLAGANPMTVDLGQIYPDFENNVLNAVTAVGWEAVEATKIYELGTYFLDYEMQVNPTFIIMNKAKYESLSDEHKAIIDGLGGHAAVDIQGEMREEARQKVYDEVNAAGGEVYTLSDSEKERFRELGSEASAAWRDQVNATGVDAEALEAKCAGLFEKYAAQYPYTFN